jgi:thiamine kinase-like enzyme
VREAAGKASSLLSVGYATTIHGDMHPGNLRTTGEGLKFVDWGYCIPSLNLFDLGYIETIAWDDPPTGSPWWTITPGEACEILPAYHAACGLTGVDYQQVQLAVMFWSKLWAYENCMKFSNPADAAINQEHLVRLAGLL